MGDYISREAADKAILREYYDGNGSTAEAMWRLHLEITRGPAADVAPVAHGEWVATDMYLVDECSNCGFQICWEDVPRWLAELPRFKCRCPNCQAEMKNGDER